MNLTSGASTVVVGTATLCGIGGSRYNCATRASNASCWICTALVQCIDADPTAKCEACTGERPRLRPGL